MATRVTDDGQVTIPQAVLDQAGIAPGSEVTVRSSSNGSVVIERVGAAEPLDPDRFEKVRGTADAGFSTEDIMAMTRGD